ncbi:furin-like isoform X2 [Corticium candelabrum]|uniref:furin-like isoform X2 n=1 Tax=Corticium candelabrum TaxID=121492 RepID=UPI002E277180|nr:furin-like isoform X2 [Corticium candelabrum]
MQLCMELVIWARQQKALVRVKRNVEDPLDPLWKEQWYISSTNPELSHGILTAWRSNRTGRGVVVAIIDDGLEIDHPDLRDNYDPKASYDFIDNDPIPQIHYDSANSNKHGTRCAGVVAAASNQICGIGVAFRSRIGGIRLLNGRVTDITEASALGFGLQYIHIYLASWGPDDNGKKMDGPGYLARKALRHGAIKGRRGLGSIYVWASGNGRSYGDTCSCDGFVNSVYSIAISSVDESGRSPWYSEWCASILASAFSNSKKADKRVISTDLHGKCTDKHSGTSAAASIAAGIFAIALEVNMNLTWRCLQHMVVRTSKVISPTDNDWVINGAGYRVSHKFGFGLVDAAGLTALARVWARVPKQHVCVETVKIRPQPIQTSARHGVVITSLGCRNSHDEVRFLEHVVAIISLTSTDRGSIRIVLTSPMGTPSELLHPRRNDHSKDGILNWPFMTTHCWGENPQGEWILHVRKTVQSVEGILQSVTLYLYGTKEDPKN